MLSQEVDSFQNSKLWEASKYNDILLSPFFFLLLPYHGVQQLWVIKKSFFQGHHDMVIGLHCHRHIEAPSSVGYVMCKRWKRWHFAFNTHNTNKKTRNWASKKEDYKIRTILQNKTNYHSISTYWQGWHIGNDSTFGSISANLGSRCPKHRFGSGHVAFQLWSGRIPAW